jgi:8-oxo-dGTP diphosphatase
MLQITVKIKLVLFGIVNDTLVVFSDRSLLPAIVITPDVSLEKQVETLFFQTTGEQMRNSYSEQLYTITNDKNEISIVYYALLTLQTAQQGFTKVSAISKKAEDHAIIAYAIQRLQWKIEYTNVVYSLLPLEFTLSELQKTYEAILGYNLDKRNFRKKILSLKFLEPSGKKRFGVSRPAQMYMFKKRTPTMVKIFS